MAEQKLSTWLIGFMFLSLFIVGGATMAGYINDQYGIDADNDYGTTFDRITELTDNAASLNSDINDSSSSSNPVSTVLNAFVTPITVAWDSFQVMTSLTNETIANIPILGNESGFKFNIYLTRVIQAALIIMLALIIYNIIFRVGRAA